MGPCYFPTQSHIWNSAFLRLSQLGAGSLSCQPMGWAGILEPYPAPDIPLGHFPGAGSAAPPTHHSRIQAHTPVPGTTELSPPIITWAPAWGKGQEQILQCRGLAFRILVYSLFHSADYWFHCDFLPPPPPPALPLCQVLCGVLGSQQRTKWKQSLPLLTHSVTLGKSFSLPGLQCLHL